MSYTETNKKDVCNMIDSYTADTLDEYIRLSAKKVATDSMEYGHEPIKVADSVFDFLNNGFSGNVVMAATCKQICPKNILLVLRNDIINKLK